MSRFDIYKDEDMLLQGEMDGDTVFIHCEVFDWSPSHCRKLYSVWEQVLDKFEEKGVNSLYALIDNENTKKFSEMFGFIPKYRIEDNEGNKIYISEMEVF